MPPVMGLADYGIDRLEPEPQEGPIEYKLHLLLRPRRSFVASSTLQLVSGLHPSKAGSVRLDPQSDLKRIRSSPSPKPNNQSRQNRLQSLTTQLLWRLQQSSPFHASSRSELVVPILPRDGVTEAVANGPDNLLPGLEESQGALYEIGVSDDGTFVGLTEDELEESLNTLRVMAFSLGCNVDVVRRVVVGDCHWFQDSQPSDESAGKLCYGNLMVAEALVVPNFNVGKQTSVQRSLPFEHIALPTIPSASSDDEVVRITESQTEQLRVSLAGGTASGKSSLLGTLSSSTLDNGRGKSRLCLLKHRHEIESGVSSSVTPELIGYQDSFSNGDSGGGLTPYTNIVNYASGNVSSWNDIHSASDPGRLVLVTDSAGRPKYQRTMMRGLISWAPHWTLCCIPADRDGDYDSRPSSTAGDERNSASGVDDGGSSRAHLSLCLKLGLPLVVVITKFDLTTKVRLRSMLSKILSLLKAAGRRPYGLSTTTVSDQDHLLRSTVGDDEGVTKRIKAMLQDDDLRSLVPVTFTSAVNGTGINQIHALLRHLPIFNPRHNRDRQGSVDYDVSNTVFHVDEVFTRSEGYMHPSSPAPPSAKGTVLSGHLRYGAVSIGDHLLVGPLQITASSEAAERLEIHQVDSESSIVKPIRRNLKISHQDRRSWSEEAIDALNEPKLASAWRKVRVESLRNLRLPVRKLLAGQVGTVGISWAHEESKSGEIASTPPFRKGMVMISSSAASDDRKPSSFIGFCASFDSENALSPILGSTVIVYIASIRSVAKILSISPRPRSVRASAHDFRIDDGDDDANDENDAEASDSDGGIAVLNSASSSSTPSDPHQEVTFRFLASREWIELGTTVLVVPGGGVSDGRGDSGSGAGLNGFVGRITSLTE